MKMREFHSRKFCDVYILLDKHFHALKFNFYWIILLSKFIYNTSVSEQVAQGKALQET